MKTSQKNFNKFIRFLGHAAVRHFNEQNMLKSKCNLSKSTFRQYMTNIITVKKPLFSFFSLIYLLKKMENFLTSENQLQQQLITTKGFCKLPILLKPHFAESNFSKNLKLPSNFRK